MSWNKEGINERLRELVEVERLSFSQTAAAINHEFGTEFSRSACIARAHRTGMHVPADHRKFGGTRKPKTNAGGVTRALIAKSVRQESAPLPPTPIIDEEIPNEQRKTLLQLTSTTCRWPVGEGAELFFCGGLAVPKHPYCPGHLDRAYSKHHRVTDEGRLRMAYGVKRPSLFGQAA